MLVLLYVLISGLFVPGCEIAVIEYVYVHLLVDRFPKRWYQVPLPPAVYENSCGSTFFSMFNSQSFLF